MCLAMTCRIVLGAAVRFSFFLTKMAISVEWRALLTLLARLLKPQRMLYIGGLALALAVATPPFFELRPARRPGKGIGVGRSPGADGVGEGRDGIFGVLRREGSAELPLGGATLRFVYRIGPRAVQTLPN